MKDIPRQRGRRYIDSLVAQGEHDRQDFKFAISDARKIARSISAFSNAGGGRLLIGVKDNGIVAGVRNEEDVFMVEQAAERYCSPSVDVEFTAFTYDSNIVVIRAEIPPAPRRPVRSQEPDGKWRAYFRVADENIAAHPLMVRAWMARDASFSLDSETSLLLAAIDANPAGCDITSLARTLGLSLRRTDELVVALAASGVLSFRYRGGEWRVARSIPNT